MLYPINQPKFTVWLFVLLEVFGNMCIVITCFPVCDVLTFKANHSFFIRKNIFGCPLSVHNTISLSRHEQVYLMRLCFERYFSHYEKKGKVSLEKQPLKYSCSQRDKFIVSQLSDQAFFSITKKSRQKSKSCQNKRCF